MSPRNGQSIPECPHFKNTILFNFERGFLRKSIYYRKHLFSDTFRRILKAEGIAFLEKSEPMNRGELFDFSFFFFTHTPEPIALPFRFHFHFSLLFS